MKTRRCRRGGVRTKGNAKKRSPSPSASTTKLRKTSPTIPPEVLKAIERSSITKDEITEEQNGDYIRNQPHEIELKPSTLGREAGNGAFAREPLEKGQILGCYVGKVVSNKTKGDYVIDTGAGFSFDAEPEEYSNWTRTMNTGTWDGITTHPPNVEFVRGVDEKDIFSILVRVIRDIEPGEELFIDYGKEY